MVSQKNIQTVKEVSEQLKKYPVIGILDMFKLPASQLHQIRTKLRGKAMIRMVKKRLIILALKEAGLRGGESLSELLQGEPALLLSEHDPFKLARMIAENKSEAPAKEGDIAPRDIMITAGPTSLPPGPVIGELQKAKIPAMIEGEKIHVREDTVVAREGDEIDGLLAGVLAKLGITPMEIGLNLLAVWESGTVYGKDILFIPQERYVQDLVSAHQSAFNLAYNAGYPTKDTLPLLLGKAHQEAMNLAMGADILTRETVEPLLAKAHAQAEAVKANSGFSEQAPAQSEPSPEAPKTEVKEDESEKKEAPEPESPEPGPETDKPEGPESPEPPIEEKDDAPKEEAPKEEADSKKETPKEGE